jgi:hypothetical protein
MLIVNTAKISLEEFAKKWGFNSLDWLEIFTSRISLSDGEIHIINDEDSQETMVADEALDVLYDMIAAGDVIKLERK